MINIVDESLVWVATLNNPY